MKKRVISMILALALCLGLLPVVPVAALDETGIWFDQVNSEGAMEEGEQSWSADRFNGSTTDVVWNGEVIYVIGKDQNVTIDGNLTIDGSGLKYLILFENATLTIKGALILKRDGLSILGHTASLQPGDIGQIVIENSKNPSGAAIRSEADSGESYAISLCGGKLTAKGGQYGAVDHVTLWKKCEVLKATLGEDLLPLDDWADEKVTFSGEKDLVIEWCEHDDDYEGYIQDGETQHRPCCTACGFEWSAVECFTPVTLSPDIVSNGDGTHTLKCICGREKIEACSVDSLKEPEVTSDGKGHTSSMCIWCGYTTGGVEDHTDWDEHGACGVCKFKPVFEDSEGNLYGYDSSYSIDALNEAIANGVTSFKLVNFAEGDGADTTTVEASFSLETEAEVTLDMNGKTLTHGSGEPTLTVSSGTLTVTGDAAIGNTGSAEMAASAVKVTGGELIFQNALNATGSSGTSAASSAIEVTGGKVTFEGDVKATGGLLGRSGNAMTCQPAIYANGGELDFQGTRETQVELDLRGGLTLESDATLTHLLTTGKFYQKPADFTGSGTGAAVSVENSTKYRYVDRLLADKYIFKNLDPSGKNQYFATSFTLLSGWDVTIVEHEHKWGPSEGSDNYACTECGVTCIHEGGYTDGKCSICGKPCSHGNVDSLPNGKFCRDCEQKMLIESTKGERGNPDFKYAYFTSLKDAMAAAEDGWIMKLLDDINNDYTYAELTGDDKTVTLNLDGHTINEGWIYVGIDENNYNNKTSSTLKITGNGSFINTGDSGNLTISEKGTLDLSGWTGGKITRVNPSKKDDDESALIVGENAGTIETLGINSWPTDSANDITYIKNIQLSGGRYGAISITMNAPSGCNKAIPYSSMLATGYAFQYNSGEFVEYAAKAEYGNGGGNLSNVRVVKCTNHVNADDNKLCDYCNADLLNDAVATLTTGDRTYYYTDLPAAVATANVKGGIVTLLADVTLSGTLTIGNIGAVKDITLDLNGHTITDTGTPSGSGKDRLIQIYTSGTVTICDGSQAQSGTIESKVPGGYPVCLSDGTLTIEGGTFKGDQYALEANISPELTIKGGTFKGGILSYARSNTISGGTFLGAVAVKYTTKISGGRFASLSSDQILGSLLADGYAFRSTAEGGTWLREQQLAQKTANNITAVAAPIQSVTLTSDAENHTVEYGTPVKLTADCKTAAGVTDFKLQWYEIVSGEPTGMDSGLLTNLSVGTHKYRVVATADGYSRSADITITVNKAKQGGEVSMKGYTYNETPSTPTLTGRAGDLNAAVTYYYSTTNVNSGGTEWKDIEPTTLNVGTYYMYAVIAETENYKEFTTTAVAFKVEKASPTPYTKPSGLTAKYGQKLSDITLPNPEGNLPGTWSWNEPDTVLDQIGTIKYDAYFTPDNTNYKRVVGAAIDVTVGPADGKVLATVKLTQKFTDDGEHTYTPDWSDLPEGPTWSYNSEASIQLPTHTFTADGKTLTYAITGGKAGDVVTITLKAQCSNYEDFTIVLKITLTERDPQPDFKFDTKETTVTYGDESFILAATGAQTSVTYVSDNPSVATVDKDTGKVTIVGAGKATITATAAQTKDFDKAEASYQLTVKQAVVTITALDKRVYVGGKAPDLTSPAQDTDYTVSGLLGEDKLNIEPTLKYVDAEGNEVTPDTTKTGEYIIRASGAMASANYTIEYADGKLSIVRRPASGGSNTPVYPVRTPDKTENGTISTDPKSAEKGETVTITVKPDTGYELGDLIVTDKNGDRVNVINRGNGKFTFVMPEGGVTIRASFVEETENSPFRDVPKNAYYYKAVAWAAKNDITGGIGNGLFGPELGCTRAQFVTFLWRACGSPAPKALSKFTDVPADAYYAKAVAWAVENGITDGTSPTTFSPNQTCTRAHAVTFLWRALGKPSGSSAAFTDVPSGAYYAKAVAWAAENDVTTGVGGGRFAPDDTCTRAQIVTFLYRCMR